MAHDVLEGDCEFLHDCVPYEFIVFASSIANVLADNLDLAVDPVSNLGSSYKGKE
jgi:hypothetical protein